jgi:hypothetical protein
MRMSSFRCRNPTARFSFPIKVQKVDQACTRSRRPGHGESPRIQPEARPHVTKRKPHGSSASTKTAHEKGTELEQAIGAIERRILRANPNLSEKSYTIDFRKIIVVDGVKHEIDVWIEFDLGSGYKSIFIFEARNWDKTVGKDHIIVFSAKIAAANAQAGFFVAKSLSKSPWAAAENDARIRILKATDDFAISDRVRTFHVAHQDQSKSHADFQLVVKPVPLIPPSFNLEAATLTLNGDQIDYQGYANGLVRRLIHEHSLTVPSQRMDDGVYWFDVTKEFDITPDVMLVDGYEVQSIKMKLRYPFEIIRAPIVSKFDIETRGRVYVYQGIPIGNYGSQQVTIIEGGNQFPEFLVSLTPPPLPTSK